MEGIEMGADTFGRGEVLCRGSSGFEDLVLYGLGLALGLVGGRDVLHGGWLIVDCFFVVYLLETDWEREREVADKNTYIEERAIQNTAHYDVGQVLRNRRHPSVSTQIANMSRVKCQGLSEYGHSQKSRLSHVATASW
jgi:hypothetical protein